MPRVSRFTTLMSGLLVAAAATGCQGTSGTRVSHAESPRLWTADGGQTQRLVSGRAGDQSVRLASLKKQQGSGSFSELLGGSREERIPLPRTETRSLHQIESPSADVNQGIGAF